MEPTPRDWERELAEMTAQRDAREQSRDHWRSLALQHAEAAAERDAALSRVAELTAELRKSEQDAITWAKAAHPNHIADVIARAKTARAEGYQAGVEDAATVATGMPFAPGALGVIAEAIRALAKESKE